jgi:O-antigen/teichoic acid export membrane protein
MSDFKTLFESTTKAATIWWDALHARYNMLADAGALFASAVVNAGMGFIFWVVAARLYSPENVGIGTAIISGMTLMGNISRLGLDIALVRSLPGFSQEQRQSVINGSLLIVTLVGILVSLVFALQPAFANEITYLLRQSLWIMLGFALTCAGWGIGLVLEPILVVSKRGQYVVLKGFVFSLVRLIGLAPLVLPIFDQRLSVFMATSIGVAAGLMIGWRGLGINITRHWDTLQSGLAEIRSSLAGYAIKNYISSLIAGLPGWLLPIIIVERSGAPNAAYFYTSWMIMVIVNNGPSALGFALLTEGARQGQASWQLFIKAIKYALLYMIPAVLAILLVGSRLMAIFGSGYSEGSHDLLPYLAIAGIPFAIVQICFMELRLEKELLSLILAATLFSGITIIGSYLLLPRMGITSIGLVWLVSCVVTAIISIWLVVHNFIKAKENN